jgi:hypothetical protein
LPRLNQSNQSGLIRLTVSKSDVDEDEVVPPRKKQKVLPKPKVTDLLAGRKEKEKKDKERKE